MRGGEVAMHVGQHMPCEVNIQFTCSTADYEILCLPHKSDLFAVIYHPPSCSQSAFALIIEQLLDYATLTMQCTYRRGFKHFFCWMTTVLLGNSTSNSALMDTSVITTPTRV